MRKLVLIGYAIKGNSERNTFVLPTACPPVGPPCVGDSRKGLYDAWCLPVGAKTCTPCATRNVDGAALLCSVSSQSDHRIAAP